MTLIVTGGLGKEKVAVVVEPAPPEECPPCEPEVVVVEVEIPAAVTIERSTPFLPRPRRKSGVTYDVSGLPSCPRCAGRDYSWVSNSQVYCRRCRVRFNIKPELNRY